MAKTTQKSAAGGTLARVLVRFDEAGSKLKPNQLVLLAASRAAALEKEGRVSADEAGIAWCRKDDPEAKILDLTAQAADEGEADKGGEGGQTPAAE